MALANRDLAVGTVLTATYKKKERTCEMVQTDDGLRFRLDDGREFTSPSSAGKAAMGGVSCNGWRFWSMAVPARTGRARSGKQPKVKAPAKKVKNKHAQETAPRTMRAAAKDDASYSCGVCGATFTTMKAATQHATEAHLS